MFDLLFCFKLLVHSLLTSPRIEHFMKATFGFAARRPTMGNLIICISVDVKEIIINYQN